MRSIRVQGEQFQKIKQNLWIESYTISTNGNIRVDFKHKQTGVHYHHWLSPENQAKFESVMHNYKQKRSFNQKNRPKKIF